ncbi:MAG: hybrid sensor histidine kinase/response regulator [Verrucomicrobiota bacterium]
MKLAPSVFQSSSNTANIMVVDDTPANLHLLTTLLVKYGYSVRAVINGGMALQAARRLPPDLILLDARMPKMDGYEVCKQLKADPMLKEIPVIFVSAHGEVDDKVKAFDSGGVDFITKPFQAEEVQCRIRTHLETHWQQLDAKQKHTTMERLVQLRSHLLDETTQKLSQLDDAKNQFLTIISHELRTPLNGLLGIGELALSELPNTPRSAEYKKIFDVSRQRILLFLEDALLLSSMQVKDGQLTDSTSQLDGVLETAVNECGQSAQANDQRISAAPRELGLVLGDSYFLTRAITRLIETGFKFSKPKGEVVLSARPLEHEVLVAIKAQGYSVSEKDSSNFFEVLAIGRAVTPHGDTGLSPAVAGQIINRLGGQVTIKNTFPTGVEIVAHLPRPAPVKVDNGLPST